VRAVDVAVVVDDLDLVAGLDLVWIVNLAERVRLAPVERGAA